MRPLWKDILAALWLGVLLPGIVLNGTVLAKRHRAVLTETVRETEPARQVPQILLRTAEGNCVPMDMTAYLTGVLLGEMPAEFEPEALKAQAVAAGTYVRKAGITGGKHGDGSVCADPGCCQAYLSEDTYLSMGGTLDSVEKVAAAVASVSPFVLLYEGELIEAVYFSCSGGTTESAVEVWGADYPYLQSVNSPGEESAAYHTDTQYFSAEEFQEKLGKQLGEDPRQWFGVTELTAGGGVAVMEIGEESYTGVQLRSLLGLRSTSFCMAVHSDTVIVHTKGYGHRVGMSQYGANAMAQAGHTWQQILQHYYPGTTVAPLA